MVNIPDFTDKNYISLATFVEKAKSLADQAYARTDGRVNFIDEHHFVPQSWETFKGQLCSRFKKLSEEGHAQIGNHLAELGQVYTTPLKNGDQASTFLLSDIGYQFYNVTRISAKPSNKASPTTTANNRSLAPHMLQATHIFNVKSMQAQVMPCVAMYDTYNMNAFISLMRKLYEDTCFMPHFDGYTKDTAVLPDGTVLYVDPGAIVYRDGFYKLSEEDRVLEIQRSNALIAQRCKDWKLPDQLQPLNANGSRKQHDFFTPPSA